MEYQYNHLIPQNIAPKSAKSIGVYRGGKKICNISLGNLAPPTKAKLYSFGLISDMHMSDYRPASSTKFDNALSYFEEQGALFCCHSGDISDYGFWKPISTGISAYNPVAFEEYKRITQKHSIPVYGCCGNHESQNGYDIVGTYTDTQGTNPSLVVNNLQKLQEYTGKGLYFTVGQGDDVFIFVGQPNMSKPMNDEAFSWLCQTLEANKNKRCFVFVHPHISSGNPMGAYDINDKFRDWSHLTEFKSLLKQHPNAILFHGHSHTRFECQELDENANYSTKDGFKSVHVPSLGLPRKVMSGELVDLTEESQGYLVDVYEDYIVLNGMDFIYNKPVPLGTYKIDTE